LIVPAVAEGRTLGPRRDLGLRAKTGRPSIFRIAASVAVFALVWYASLRTVAASRGAVNVAAKAVFLTLTCLACIVTGFLLPMVPGASAVVGGAFWAGLLASGGALAGMAVSDAILVRIEQHEAGASASPGRTEAGEKTRPRV
jgi:hypothetical protein